MRLQKQLFYSILAVTILTMLVIYVAAAFFSLRSLESSRVHDLAIKAGELADLTEDFSNRKLTPDVFVRMINNVDDMLDAHVWVFGKNGEIMVLSERGPSARRQPQTGATIAKRVPVTIPEEVLASNDGRQMVSTVLSGHEYQGTYYNGYYDEDMLTVSVPFNFNGQIAGGIILYSSFAHQVGAPLSVLFIILIVISVLVIIIDIFVTRIIARSLTKPINNLTAVANRFAEGDFSAFAVKDGNYEVAALGAAFNKMSADILKFIDDTNQSERMRREFIANLSHEMRTPLTVIRGYAEAIYDGTISVSDSKHSVAVMRDEALRLERLIKDMLELSKLQLDKYELEIEIIPLAAAVKQAFDTLRKKAAEKDAKYTFEDRSSQACVRADFDRIIQVMIILLDNAVKFSYDGGDVRVVVECVNGSVVASVTDNGCGISKEDLPFIWERFYKADKSHNRDNEGMGLGLSIAREIIEKHGARIDIESSDEAARHGTIFTLIFNKEDARV